MDIIVFAGIDETIVGAAANVNKLVEDWFLNGERNLDEYDVYVTDGGEGVAVQSRQHAEIVGRREEPHIIDLMPNVLRDALVAKGLLTDDE